MPFRRNRTAAARAHFELVFHAVADIEDDAQAQRRCSHWRRWNFLLDLVFEELEVLGSKFRDDVSFPNP